MNQKKKLALIIEVDSFIVDIYQHLSKTYEVIAVTSKSMKDIEDAVNWADIVWFEFCNEMFLHAINQNLRQHGKRVIARWHRFEIVESSFPERINFRFIDDLILVSHDMKRALEARVPGVASQTRMHVLWNGLNLDRFKPSQTLDRKKIAWVAKPFMRKNQPFFLQVMHKLVQRDPSYTLHVAGAQEQFVMQPYLARTTEKLGLSKNVFYYNWQQDMPAFLADKGVILSTSIHESFGYNIAEAMAIGALPVVHDYPGAEEFWPDEIRFSSIDEAVELVVAGQMHRWIGYVHEKFPLQKQLAGLEDILEGRQINTGNGALSGFPTPAAPRIEDLLPVRPTNIPAHAANIPVQPANIPAPPRIEDVLAMPPAGVVAAGRPISTFSRLAPVAPGQPHQTPAPLARARAAPFVAARPAPVPVNQPAPPAFTQPAAAPVNQQAPAAFNPVTPLASSQPATAVPPQPAPVVVPQFTVPQFTAPQMPAASAPSFDSNGYWETRYRNGGNSGAGSYDTLARYKGLVLNFFAKKQGINSVAEMGSGDGNQLRFLMFGNYTGFDVSQTAIERCKAMHGGNPNYRFVWMNDHAMQWDSYARAYDCSLSLDVIYHLVDDQVYERYLDQLFSLSRRYVVIYASNYNGPDIRGASHVRNRKFTDDVARRFPQWTLLKSIENPYKYKEATEADFFIYGLDASENLSVLDYLKEVA